MDFIAALRLLKRDTAIRRKIWGKDMFLEMSQDKIFLVDESEKTIELWTNIQQVDILAKDWMSAE